MSSQIPQRRWTPKIYRLLHEVLANERGSKIAAFDFDNTLIQGDLAFTVIENHLASDRWDEKNRKSATREALDFLANYPDTKYISNEWSVDHTLQESNAFCGKILTLLLQKDLNFAYHWSRFFFAGQKPVALTQYSSALFEKALLQGDIGISREMLELLQILQEKKWRIAVITASPEFLFGAKILSYFGLGQEQLSGMRLQCNSEADPEIQPKILEPMTSFAGKVQALKKKYSEPPDLAFGDSTSDIPMLQYAKNGILFSKEKSVISLIEKKEKSVISRVEEAKATKKAKEEQEHKATVHVQPPFLLEEN